MKDATQIMENNTNENVLLGDGASRIKDADSRAFFEKLEDPRVFHRVCTRLILSCNLRAKAYLRNGLSVEYQHNRECADVLTKLLREWEEGRGW